MNDQSGRGHGERPGIRHYVSSVAGFWRSAVNDHVVGAARLRPGDVVLDIGAGLGPATIPAARQGAYVLAIEPSRMMRTGLRIRRRWQRGRRQIEVVAGTAEHLPLDDASVDIAWAVNAMHHWTDMAAAARELRRVVRPGGRVVLVDEDFDDPAHVMAHTPSSHHDTYPMIDPDAVAAAFVDAGFAASGRRMSVAGNPVLHVTAALPATKRA